MTQYNKRGRTLAAALIATAVMLPQLSAAKSVTVKGEAAIENDNKAAARKLALKDAFRKAVEQVAGVQVQSTTVSSEWEIVKDEIIAKTQGMVTSHKVLSEGDKGGVFEIEIKADVADKAVSSAIGQLISIKKNSKIAVLLAEKMAGNTDFTLGTQERGKTEDILINSFQERGFTVVDLSGLAGLNLSTGSRTGELNAADAQAVADLADAQYIVVGKVEGRDAGQIMGTKMRSYQMAIHMRIFEVSNHTIIATVTDTATVPSVSANFGNKMAMTHYKKQLEKRVMNTFIQRIAKSWTQEEQTGTKRVQLVLQGVPNYKAFKKLYKALGKLPGVAKATKRNLKNKKAKVDMEMDTDAEALADKLSEGKLAGYKIEVSEVSEGRIVVTVKK